MLESIKRDLNFQINSKQPSLIVIILSWAIPGIIVSLLSKSLLSYPTIRDIAQYYRFLYMTIYFIIYISITIFFIYYFFNRYESSLHIKPLLPKNISPRLIVALIILFPILAWRTIEIVKFVYSIMVMSNVGAEQFKAYIQSGNYKVWTQLAYGYSTIGVVYTSINSLFFPILEECIFTGFILNKSTKRFNLAIGIVLTASIFMSAHIYQFGIGIHLLHLFLYSFTYILVRLTTGSIYYSIFAHILVNIMIFLPKWGFFIINLLIN